MDKSTVYYRLWYNGIWTGWLNNLTKNDKFQFMLKDLGFNAGDNGMFYMEYYSVDSLGNMEATINNETMYVNNTIAIPPESYVNITGGYTPDNQTAWAS